LKESNEDIIKILEKDCSQILSVLKKNKKYLYRGTKKRHEGLKVFTTRDDRKPRDTKPWLHELIDEAFKKEFGWSVRKEGVFATSDWNEANLYGGRVNLFFPFNGYKYVWGEGVTDLTANVGSVNYDIDTIATPESIVRSFVPAEFDEVTKPNLKTGKGSGHWQMFVPEENSMKSFSDYNDIISYYKDKGYGELEFVRVTDTNKGMFYSASFRKKDASNALRQPAWAPKLKGADKERLLVLAKEALRKAGEQKIKELMYRYKDKELNIALIGGEEISFKCDKYYLINENEEFGQRFGYYLYHQNDKNPWGIGVINT
jgi:hypothetical protein